MAETVRSIADFLAVVRKSGLVEEAKLAEAVAGWPDTSLDLPDELPQALIDAELLTHWQADQLRKGKHKGFMLGKYRLLRLLGAGGMSSVYLAENTTLRKQVAIKVLPIKRVEQSSFLARFEREAQAAFGLGHQNIARAFDLDTAGSVHFIVMEYIDGIDLHAKVKQDGPLEIRDAVDYIRQAAIGLHYAHGEGLVHRDIKPANLILDRKGVVRILDLGLALAGDDDKQASLTREHDEKVLGTADYLAPEQATDSHKADRRSDVYSLGCTLHYLLTGKPPFSAGKLGERIRAHKSTPPPNLLEARADVPPVLAELYFRMMEKHPEARPQTAKEVADALDAWLASSAAKPGDPPEPPRRAPPRRTPAPGSDVKRILPPGTVIRSGPSSSAGRVVRPGGSGALGPGRPAVKPASSSPAAAPRAQEAIDLSQLSFDQPAPGAGAPAARPPAAQPTSAPHVPHRRSPGAQFKVRLQEFMNRQVAGLPMGFWIVVGAAALAVIGLLAGLAFGG